MLTLHLQMVIKCKSTPRGFEPLRAEPNGFLVHLLNRSDTVSSGSVEFLNNSSAWKNAKATTCPPPPHNEQNFVRSVQLG